MKQRLVMCAAFLHRPRAVLVDEPMVGLDPRGALLIKDVFRRMASDGVAILMSTHTLEVAEEMCDRISIILGGKIIAEGTVAELQAAAGARDEALTPIFLRLTGGSGFREIEDARDPGLPLPAPAVALGRAQSRPPAREGRFGARRPVRRHRGGGRDRPLRDRLLADLAAPRLRGARRLPRPARPRLALPDLPVFRGLQRGRHLAEHVLPVRGPAPPAPRPGPTRPAVPLALRADRRAVLVDGRGLRPAGAPRDRPRAVRAGELLRHRRRHRRALRRDPLRPRLRWSRSGSSPSSRPGAPATC